MHRFRDWAKREHSDREWGVTLGLAGVLFLLILPFILVTCCPRIDRRFHLPGFATRALTPGIGVLATLGGFSLALWSIYTQVTIGLGTPVPTIPTKKLVVKGPFVHCRNPMTLGTIVGYLGISVLAGSVSAIALVLTFAGTLMAYLKLIEERELAARFGSEYLEYKRKTPFMLPRFRRR